MNKSSLRNVSVLVVKNVLSEGPGTIADHLRQAGIRSRVVELHAGEELPGLSSFSHLVVLGGPMAVYEMAQYPYLASEAAFLEQAINAGKTVLGVCLGAQMLAHVLGGRVYPGGAKEIGWCDVDITPEGMNDPFVSALAVGGKRVGRVFQWHGDTFDLPAGAIRLASSGLYPNQAFRYGKAVYALQFHIEVTPEIVREWLAHEKSVDIAVMNAESERIFEPYLGRASNAYARFFHE